MSKKHIIIITLVLLTGYATIASALINPGDTLDPVATNPTECPNGPTDPTCIVTLPSGGSITADNGLTTTGSNVQLGGTLIQDTNINIDTHNFTTTGTGNIDLSSSVDSDFITHIQASDDILGLSSLFGVNIKGAGFFYQRPSNNMSGIIFAGDASATGGSSTPLDQIHIGVEDLTGVIPLRSAQDMIVDNTNGYAAHQVYVEDTNSDTGSTFGLQTSSGGAESYWDVHSSNIFTNISLRTNDGIRIQSNTIDYSTQIYLDQNNNILQLSNSDYNGSYFNYLTFNPNGNGISLNVNDNNNGYYGVVTVYPNSFQVGNYHFPYTDGTFNQVLATDGSGQLSWKNTGDLLKWYAENTIAPTTAPIATGSGSIAFGDGAQALSNNMFVYGNEAGVGITAPNVNSIGQYSGFNAINAKYANFFGFRAGYGATDASSSNFFGDSAGVDATGASSSNFLGSYAGFNAQNAANSNFIGKEAGFSSSNASNSIFIGTLAGNNDTVNNTTNPNDFSILIGPNTKTGGFSNSIALGGYATNTATNQLMIGSTTHPIDQTKIIGSLGTECTITTGTGMACTSDERLKTNITDLTSDTLSKLQNVRTVSYNWLQNPNSPTQIGFLAQNLEQYFPEMVMTDATGKKQVYYSQMTPILVEAIRELNLKVDTLQLANGSTSTDIFSSLKNWLGDVENGIDNLYAKVFHANRVETQELCVGQTCLNEQQVQSLLQVIGSQGIGFQNDQPLDPSTTSDDTGNSDSTTLDPEVDSSDTSVSSTDSISTTDNSDTGTIIDMGSSDNTIDSTPTE